jgi:Xaa-Pro aminopeptidase
MLVVPPKGRARLIAPRLELAAARATAAVEAGLVQVETWEETDDPIDLLTRAGGSVGGLASSRSVLVSDRLAAAFLLPIQARTPQALYGLASTVLSELRSIKDEEEIELLRRAARAADRTVAAITGGRLVGRSEADVAREVRDRLVDEGHEFAAFSIVASGPNSASPHHHPTDRVISPGEPIVLDIGGSIEGYGSDITRTIWVTGGDPAKGPDDTYRGLFATLAEAQAQATEAARPGSAAEAVDAVARGIIGQGGYGDAFIHRTGHGIGLEGHEDPYLVAGNTEPLRERQAFSVEPGIYLEGRYGARIEDIVVCRRSGPDVLNRAPRSLAVVSGT